MYANRNAIMKIEKNRRIAGQTPISLNSNGQFNAIQFGLSNDLPVPDDYNNCHELSNLDGKANIAVWRPSTGAWYYIPPEGGNSDDICVRWWGTVGDIPISLIQN